MKIGALHYGPNYKNESTVGLYSIKQFFLYCIEIECWRKHGQETNSKTTQLQY